MQIVMIGAGYVGLVSGACFADFGHVVTCVDKDGDKIAGLLRGEMPIFEPGLAELVAKNAREERLLFTTELAGGGWPRTPSSSRSARRRGAATAMPISPTCSRRRARSPPISTATR